MLQQPSSQDIIRTNVLSKLIQNIIKTNVLSKFHKDWTINLTFRVKNAPAPWQRTINLASRVFKRTTAPPLGGHVFQANATIFELVQNIIWANLLTNDDQKINVSSRVLTRKNAPPPGGHAFEPTGTIFELIQYIIAKYLLTIFHEDQTINMASRVNNENAPPPLATMFFNQPELLPTSQSRTLGIIETHLLTKFHEDLTINVASRVLTRQIMTPHDGQKAITKAHHENIVLRYM
ncbi:hypothetical protein DPMN_049921 [Dreissena polymorpha]|uniref:Uncharacterized protein n=1 Tax=Dreissena polymorpha TaxID=45954 RepID=A0A9D4CF63_DREPO|nr:hypothetical protein DPMN_049921 [Dreissena polymorpha]